MLEVWMTNHAAEVCVFVTEQNLAAVNTCISADPRESFTHEIEAQWHWTCTDGSNHRFQQGESSPCVFDTGIRGAHDEEATMSFFMDEKVGLECQDKRTAKIIDRSVYSIETHFERSHQTGRHLALVRMMLQSGEPVKVHQGRERLQI